jgi:hypothetical protein
MASPEAKNMARRALGLEEEKIGEEPQRGPMLAWQMNDDLPQNAPNMSQEPIGPPAPPPIQPAIQPSIGPTPPAGLPTNLNPRLEGAKAVARSALGAAGWLNPVTAGANVGAALGPPVARGVAGLVDPEVAKANAGPPPPAAPGAQPGAQTPPEVAPNGMGGAMPMQLQQPQGHFRPGVGWVPTNRSIQMGLRGPNIENAERAYGSAAGHGAMAIDATEQAMQQEAQLNQLKGAAAANVNAGFEARQAQIAQRKQDARAASFRETEAAKADVAAAGNAPGYWEERGTGAQVIANIGVALGAFAASYLGGPNHAQNALNAAIETDAKQKAAKLAAARAKLGDVRDVGKDRMGALTDEQDDLDHARIANIQKVIGELDAFANTDPARRAEVEKLRQGFMNQQGGVQENLARRKEDRVAVSEGFDRGGWTGGGKPQSAPNIVRLPDGRSVSFDTPEDRKKAQERLVAAEDLQKIYDQVGPLRQKRLEALKHGNLGQAHAFDVELESLAEKAMPAWSTKNGQGQVRGEEAPRYKKFLFPFAAIDPTGAADRVIENGRQENRSSVDNITKSYGGRVVNAGYVRDPKSGRLMPIAEYAGEDLAPDKVGGNPKGFKPIGGK